jgi:uncharacterized protein YjdB
MSCAGTGSSIICNREFFSGAGGRRPSRIRGRLVLTVAVCLFLCAFLSCGGGFFTHPALTTTFISPASATISPNGTEKLAVFGKYSDGSQSEINGANVSWASSDDNVATVSSPGGLVTGVAAGSATITAAYTAVIPGAGCIVTVSVAGGSPVLSKVCTPSTTQTFNPTIVVNVTGTSVNRAVITTTQGSTVSQSTATASEAPAAMQFYAYGNGDASNDITETVTWTSSNPKVAIINSGLADGNGLLTTLSAGTTNITASTTNSSGQAVNSQTIVLTVH